MERDRVERDRHKSPSRTLQTTTDGITVMLSLRTPKDMTETLKTYKRQNDTPLTTLNRVIDNYERTSKLHH